MNISLIDVDGHNFPNLALMKLSTWHKAQGNVVDWYSPMLSRPDRIYASKVFTFSPVAEIAASHPSPICGGTGYDAETKLHEYIETMAPDYSIYPQFKEAYGFLTRGCIRSCPWCIVPQKEGGIKVVSDIETIAQGRREVVLLDNNFLAAPESFVSDQLEKATRLNLKIDFNQGLDARLVTHENARFLASCKWIRFIRFSCDTMAMIEPVKRAVSLIREAGYKREFFCYMLVQDVAEAEKRLRAIVEMNVSPFAQPYRDFTGSSQTSKEQRDFARFANVKGGKLCLKMKFKDYKH